MDETRKLLEHYGLNSIIAAMLIIKNTATKQFVIHDCESNFYASVKIRDERDEEVKYIDVFVSDYRKKIQYDIQLVYEERADTMYLWELESSAV